LSGSAARRSVVSGAMSVLLRYSMRVKTIF